MEGFLRRQAGKWIVDDIRFKDSYKDWFVKNVKRDAFCAKRQRRGKSPPLPFC